MTLKALDDFIDDCFLEGDPICNLHRDDSIWLDNYVSQLISEKTSPLEEG